MSIIKRPVSPRQKMINLMYVVLMAMLALNVSSEVLNGFSIMDESLHNSTQGAEKGNSSLYDEFSAQLLSNPVKVQPWYDKASEVQIKCNTIYNFVEDLKNAIAKEADGDNYEQTNLKNKEDLEAAAQVMLAIGKGKGQQLCNAIAQFRNEMIELIDNETEKQIIAGNLSTEVPHNVSARSWQEYMFESVPAVAAITILTKLQNDIRHAEGEVLHSLLANIDDKDIRVNALDAFVIPSSQTIVRGNKFSAKIVMAAVDTTQVPDVFIGDNKAELSNGLYETLCNRSGNFTLTGHIETVNHQGEIISKNFSQPYTVVEPTATVSADLMNVLYAGYDNPISVSVPGVPLSSVTATMTGGTLQVTTEGKYIAKPSRVGQDAVITVFSNNNGIRQQMAQHTFKVRKLPEPTPFINMKDEQGNTDHYRGGAIAKSKITTAAEIGAAVDDGILHIPFRVLSFETVFFDGMGNAVPMASEGASFSERQKESFRKLSRGRRFYISRINAIGPDGIERNLNTSMEVIIR